MPENNLRRIETVHHTEETPDDITMNQLSSPDFRSIAMENIRALAGKGELPDYSGQMGEEIETAKGTLSAFGEAERLKALPLLEESMQRRGVLTGGVTSAKLKETSEEMRLREMGLLGEAQSSILARYGGYREAERERASRQLLEETRGQTEMDIAELSARTGIAIEKLRGMSAEEVARISGEYGVKASRETGVEATKITTQGLMDRLVKEQEFYTYDGEPNWLMDFNLKQKTELMRDPETGEEISFVQHQFQKNYDLTKDMNIDPTTQKPYSYVQFQKNLSYMYDELGITEDRNKWEQAVTFATLRENIRGANMLDSRERDSLKATLDWAEKEWNLGDKQVRDLQRNVLRNNITLAEIHTTADIAQTILGIQETAREFDITWPVTESIMRSELELRKSEFESNEVYKWGVLGVDLLSAVSAGMLTDDEVSIIAESVMDYITTKGADEPPPDNILDDKDFLDSLKRNGLSEKTITIFGGKKITIIGKEKNTQGINWYEHDREKVHNELERRGYSDREINDLINEFWSS